MKGSRVDTEYLVEAREEGFTRWNRRETATCRSLQRLLDKGDGLGFAKWVQMCPPNIRTHWAIILGGYSGMETEECLEYFNRSLEWLERKQKAGRKN